VAGAGGRHGVAPEGADALGTAGADAAAHRLRRRGERHARLEGAREGHARLRAFGLIGAPGPDPAAPAPRRVPLPFPIKTLCSPPHVAAPSEPSSAPSPLPPMPLKRSLGLGLGHCYTAGTGLRLATSPRLRLARTQQFLTGRTPRATPLPPAPGQAGLGSGRAGPGQRRVAWRRAVRGGGAGQRGARRSRRPRARRPRGVEQAAHGYGMRANAARATAACLGEAGVLSCAAAGLSRAAQGSVEAENDFLWLCDEDWAVPGAPAAVARSTLAAAAHREAVAAAANPGRPAMSAAEGGARRGSLSAARQRYLATLGFRPDPRCRGQAATRSVGR
jgi:hypothetical protein